MLPTRSPFTAERRSQAQNGAGQRDDDTILAALSRIETRIGSLQASLGETEPEPATVAEPNHDDRVIETARRVAIILSHDHHGDDRLTQASAELAAIIDATEDATHRILAAAEQVTQAIDDIEIHNRDPVLSQQLDLMSNAVATIFEASSFQDITGQRIDKIVQILSFLEQNLQGLRGIWDDDHPGQAAAGSDNEMAQSMVEDEAELLNGPQLSDRGISQEEIDRFFD